MTFILIFLLIVLLERVSFVPLRFSFSLRKHLWLDASYVFWIQALNYAKDFLILYLFTTKVLPWEPRSDMNPVLAVVLVMVVQDFIRFYVHKKMHDFDLSWRFHKVHHSLVHLDAVASARRHIFDLLAYQPLFLLSTYFFIVVLRMELSYFVLATLAGAVVGGPFAHADIKFPDRWWVRALRWIIFLPDEHRLHHMDLYAQSNFGNTFTIFDRLWGTYQPVRNSVERPFGLGEEFPQTLVAQQLSPFRKMKPGVKFTNQAG